MRQGHGGGGADTAEDHEDGRAEDQPAPMNLQTAAK